MRPELSAPLRFVVGTSTMQHPKKRCSGMPNADVTEVLPTLLGLCDGFSGVHGYGNSPADLPRELLHNCRQRHEDWRQRCSSLHGGDASDPATWLRRLAEDAYGATHAQGATTLLLAAMREGDRLVTASVGDCGLLVLRPLSFNPLRLRFVFRSQRRQHSDGCPARVQRFRGVCESQARAVLRAADVQTVAVKPRDLVIMASDGLFDNLSDDDIKAAIEQHHSHKGGRATPALGTAAAAAAAAQLAQPAWAARLRESAAALVDLAIARVEAGPKGPGEAGGNADDTTALVAVVVQDQPHRPGRPGGAARGPGERSVALPIGASFFVADAPPPLAVLDYCNASAAAEGGPIAGVQGHQPYLAKGETNDLENDGCFVS